VEQAVYEVLDISRKMTNTRSLGDDVLLHLKLVLIVKRGKACDEFVKEDPKAVEIQSSSISLILQYFGTKVLRTSTDRFGQIFLAEVLLGQSKIGELKMAPLVNEYVLWLQISVQNIVLV